MLLYTLTYRAIAIFLSRCLQKAAAISLYPTTRVCISRTLRSITLGTRSSLVCPSWPLDVVRAAILYRVAQSRRRCSTRVPQYVVWLSGWHTAAEHHTNWLWRASMCWRIKTVYVSKGIESKVARECKELWPVSAKPILRPYKRYSTLLRTSTLIVVPCNVNHNYI